MPMRIRIVAISSLLVVFSASVNLGAWETSADVAFEKSRSTGSPLFIMGTKVTCGPCQRMKETLANDESVQEALDQCVVLVMDADGPEFPSLVKRFGIAVNTVPMVYVVTADEQLYYAQPGALDASQINELVTSAVDASGPSLRSEDVAQLENELEDIRKAAREGELLTALRKVTPIAKSKSAARTTSTARHYREQLVTAIGDWIVDLDGRMARKEQQYEAAYNLVKIYAHTPEEYGTIRQNAADLVKLYGAREESRIPVQQAKYLLKARHEESDRNCEQAILSYEHVKTLDPNSPAGVFAAKRIPSLRKRQATKLTKTT